MFTLFLLASTIGAHLLTARALPETRPIGALSSKALPSMEVVSGASGGVSADDRSKTSARSASLSTGNVAEQVHSLPAALDVSLDDNDNSKTTAAERTSSARPLLNLERALHRYVRECGFTELIGPVDFPPMDSLDVKNLDLTSQRVSTSSICSSLLNNVPAEKSGFQVIQVDSSSAQFLQVEHLVALLECSSLVDESSFPLWRRACLEHERCRFVNSLVLTIPLL